MFGTSRSLLPSVVLLLLCLSSVSPAIAQPENDDFENAQLLEGEFGRISGSNVRATRQGSEPIHAGAVGGTSVWYRWVAPRSGLLSVYTLGSSFDTLLAVYSAPLDDDEVEIDEIVDEDGNDDAEVGLFQSLSESVVVTEGRDYFFVVDGFGGRTGNILLTWFLGSTGARPVNDDFETSLEISGDSGSVFATTVNGTFQEKNEPIHHPLQVDNSIWFTWSPPISGEVTFDTEGSSFLQVLAAYEGSDLGALERLGRDSPIDNIDPDFPVIPFRDTPSRITFRVDAGREYHVVVAGVDDQRGTVRLNWLVTVPCDPPEAPHAPLPEDNDVGVERGVVLEWNRDVQFVERLIHGEDTRRDAFEVVNEDWRELMDSVVVMIGINDMIDNGDGTLTIDDPLSLGESVSFCESERFLDQPATGACSGFLVGEDRIATASICVRDNVDCGNVAFIFGYEMIDADTPRLTFDSSDVYFCDGILARQSNPAGADWAVIQLDRAVEGHVPLRVRRGGLIDDEAELLYIGNPFGLPTKLDDSGSVIDNEAEEFFTAAIDSSRISQGAPVINKQTLIVEGMLVRGEDDVVNIDGCFVSRQCAEGECRGQDVTRATEFEHLVPPDLADVVFEVWLGEGCSDLEMIGVTSDTTFPVPERLEQNTIYCWRIAARNECGVVFGPRWTFVTTDVDDPVYRRADSNADGAINLSDAVSLLAFLFQQGESPTCLKSADVDDNSVVNLTDPVFVLNHLFLQGPEPGAPFAECGTDPTPEDGVTCESFAPCDEG